jgi:nucleotide-binding universal stress UspA family protein
MFDLILVPLDGSKRAEAILNQVKALANCMQSEVVLLQVVEPVLMPLDPQGYMPELDAERSELRCNEAAEYLERIAAELQREGIMARCRVEQGAVVDTILEICLQEKPGLIALASHGRTGLVRVFYGSVTDGLLHKAECPMLVIRSI